MADRFQSPGVYTSEKDLSSLERASLLRRGVKGGGTAGSGTGGGGTKPKSYPWLLKCGYWNDSNYWIDSEQWEDTIRC